MVAATNEKIIKEVVSKQFFSQELQFIYFFQ